MNSRPCPACGAPPPCASGCRAWPIGSCRGKPRCSSPRIRSTSSACCPTASQTPGMRASDAVAPPAPVIRVRDVPAGMGLAWIGRGVRTFARRPGGFLGLFGVVLLAMLALLVLPPVLRLLGFVLTPLLSLGFMIGAEAVGNDLPVHPGMFVQPLAAGAAQRSALLKLGLAYVAMAAAVLLLGDRIDGGEATRWMITMS